MKKSIKKVSLSTNDGIENKFLDKNFIQSHVSENSRDPLIDARDGQRRFVLERLRDEVGVRERRLLRRVLRIVVLDDLVLDVLLVVLVLIRRVSNARRISRRSLLPLRLN